MARGRPCSSTARWTLVVRPPRDRPMAWRSAPLCRRRRNDGPWRGWSRAGVRWADRPSGRASRTPRAIRLARPSARNGCTGSSSVHIGVAHPPTVRLSAAPARCPRSLGGRQPAARRACRAAARAQGAQTARLAPLFGLPRRRSGQASPKRLSTGPTERLSPRYPRRFATSWTASDKAAPHRVCHPA